MKLTEKDKNAILKAALTAKDIDSFRDWVVSLVAAIDNAEVTEGKADVSVAVPHYVPPADRNGHASAAQSHARWDEGTLLA